MLKIIAGEKGSGKTKKIIELANKTDLDMLSIYITDTDKYMFEINKNIRFINISSSNIFSDDVLIGYIRGLIDGNYDIKNIFIDGIHRIIDKDRYELIDILKKIKYISDKSNVNFVITVSINEDEIPDII